MPPQPSVLSAFGTLVTSVRFDLVRSDLVSRQRAGLVAGRSHPGRSAREATAALKKAGCTEETVTLIVAADLRYLGQQSELTVALDVDPRDPPRCKPNRGRVRADL